MFTLRGDPEHGETKRLPAIGDIMPRPVRQGRLRCIEFVRLTFHMGLYAEILSDWLRSLA
jgi:hypothetical protein